MPLTPELKKKIIARGIRYKNGDRVVKVRPQDLVDVIGEEEAKNLIPGFDLKSLQDAERDQVLKELQRLINEEKELKELAEAGVHSARADLKQVQKELTDIRTGKVRGMAVVPIPVDALRDVLKEEQQPVPELTPEDQERFEKKLEESV